jgi:hypothetical protein
MTKTLPSMLVAGALAFGGWLLCLPQQVEVVRADHDEEFADADDDFLPDVVEWSVLTNASTGDTDGDLCPDFVEVVQRGTPRQQGVARPFDHEMRVVLTAPPVGSSATEARLHLLFRFAGDPTLLTSFRTWLELPLMPGLQVPIDVLGLGPAVIAQRQTATEGLWMRLSVPMVSEQMLRAVLPCTIRAEAVIGGRTIQTAVKLLDMQGVTCTLVPFNQQKFALQSIGQLGGPSSASTNRVCLLLIERVGSSPGGNVYEVMDADCEDCNELECGPGCPQSVGWLFTIPGGIETITGG